MLNLNIDINHPDVLCVEARPAGWAGEISVRKLFDALKNNDIPPQVWPSRPTDNKCLERALASLRDRRSLVRPLPKGRGFSLVLESPDNLDLEDNHGSAHTVEITAKVQRGEFDHSVATIKVTPEDHPAVPLIKAQYEYYRGAGGDDEGLFKCAQDLSHWFSQVIVSWCHGVATRSRGGSYYIMKGVYLDRMIRVQKALEEASVFEDRQIPLNGQTVTVPRVVQGGRIILKPEVGSAAAVEILVDQLIEECDKTCDDLAAKLSDRKLTVRGLETQKSMADDVREKLSQFEQLLGTQLEDVRARLEEVTAGVTMAEVRIFAEKDSK